MKILIIGGTGTIGSKLASHFAANHEVIVAGSNSGDISVDIENSSSIENMFQKAGNLDAAIATTGKSKWAPFDEISEEDFYYGLRNKLMGQVNLVRIGRSYINSGGSITLTTGILADDPVPGTTSAAMVNGAIHSFVKALVLELKGHLRVNVVAPGLVEDSAEALGHIFPGYNPIPMEKVVNAYRRSVEGTRTGEIIRVY
ncbi:MAG: short chain dehydrogenase [Bacteroidota bacterium]